MLNRATLFIFIRLVNMKKFLQIFIFSALSYILVISCSFIDKLTLEEQRCDYVINGAIFGTDSVLLENISVKMYEVTTDLPPKNILRDRCVSDKNGLYMVKNLNAIPYVSSTYKLHFSDLNHKYQDSVLMIVFTNEIFESGDNENFLGKTFWELNIELTK